jgi:hypothetical protein
MAGILFLKIFRTKREDMKPFYFRIAIFFLMMVIGISITNAQTSSTYLYFKPIYCFPGASQTLEQNSRSVGGATYSQGVYGSFATGLALQLGIGKMINTNFGVELAAEWLNGNKVHSDISYDTGALSIHGSGTDRIQSFMLKPMLILRSSGDLLSFYSKLGIVISVYSQGNSQGSFTAPDSNNQIQLTSLTEVTKIKPKVGFAAAFGVSARVSQAIALTLEVSGQMLSLPEKNGYYTQYEENGVNTLPSKSTFDKSWTYEKSILEGGPLNENKPDTRLYSPLNFSYIGLSLGIRYYF